MDHYHQVRRALLERRIVRASYRGHDREMCPHVIGRGPAGNPQALFYQFAGSSASGLAPLGSGDNWRCLPIDHLEDLEVVDGDWITAPNYKRHQTCVSEVDVEVDD